jgi:hypothetical protein
MEYLLLIVEDVNTGLAVDVRILYYGTPGLGCTKHHFYYFAGNPVFSLVPMDF